MATYDLNNTTIDTYVTGINASIRNEIISFLNSEGITSVSQGLYIESPPGTVNPPTGTVFWSLADDTLSVSPNSSIAAVVQNESASNSSLTVTDQPGPDFIILAQGDGSNDTLTYSGSQPAILLPGGGSNDLIDLSGSTGNATVYAGSGTETIKAGSGNDDINIAQSGAAVVVDGGSGNETVIGGNGSLTFYGSTGNYYLDSAGDGPETLYAGSAGNTSIYTHNFSEDVYLTSSLPSAGGNDSVEAIGNGALSIYGGASGSGNDTINLTAATGGTTTVYGGAGNETVIGGNSTLTFYGTTGNYYLDSNTTGGAETLYAGSAGNAAIYTHNIDETIYLSDSVPSGGGNDSVGAVGNGLLTIYGGLGSGNDTINLLAATGGAATVNGGTGNETILGGNGNLTFYGTTGDYYLDSNTTGGAETLYAGSAGNTAIYTHDIDETIYLSDSVPSGGGNDSVGAVGNGALSIYGGRSGSGNDTINLTAATGGTTTVYGGAGNENVTGGNGTLTFYGTTGNYYLDSNTTGGAETLYAGSAGNTAIYTHNIDETIYLSDSVPSGGGNDSVGAVGNGLLTIYGGLGSGNDTINLTAATGGAATVHGGTGNETILGGNGNLTFYGTTGNYYLDSNTNSTGVETIYAGSAGNATIYTHAANEDIYLTNSTPSGGGNDSVGAYGVGALSITGGAGNDTINLANSSAADTLYGGSGNETIFGSTGGDEIFGGTGSYLINVDLGSATDTVYAGSGNSTIVVNEGGGAAKIFLDTDGPTSLGSGGANDTVYGFGSGNDTIFSGAGSGSDDINLSGAQGNETINIQGTGVDTIYGANANDAINFLTESSTNASITTNGNVTTISFTDQPGGLTVEVYNASGSPATTATFDGDNKTKTV